MKKIMIVIVLLIPLLVSATSIDKAKQLLEENNSAAALEIMQKLIKNNSESVEHNYILGKTYFEEMNNQELGKRTVFKYFKEGKKCLFKAAELDPKHFESRKLLVEPLYYVPKLFGGNKEKALQFVDEIGRFNEQEASKLRIMFYREDGDYDKAIAACETYLKTFPTGIDIHYEIGMIYQEQEKWDKAFSNFEIVITNDDENRGALYQFGRSAVYSGKELEKGILYLKKYISLEFDNAYPGIDAAHWRLGLLYKALGSTGLARTEINKALKLNPGNKNYKKDLEDL